MANTDRELQLPAAKQVRQESERSVPTSVFAGEKGIVRSENSLIGWFAVSLFENVILTAARLCD